MEGRGGGRFICVRMSFKLLTMHIVRWKWQYLQREGECPIRHFYFCLHVRLGALWMRLEVWRLGRLKYNSNKFDPLDLRSRCRSSTLKFAAYPSAYEVYQVA